MRTCSWRRFVVWSWLLLSWSPLPGGRPAAATPPGPGAGGMPAATGATGSLRDIVEAYWEETLRLHPLLATQSGDHRYDDRLAIDIAPDHRTRVRDVEQRYLGAVQAVPAERLSADDRLTRELFLRQRRETLRDLEFPGHLLPVDQLFSLPVILPQLGSGHLVQPFDTVADHENWLARLDAWPAWVEQAIVNMRAGIQKGIVQPRSLVESLLPQLAALDMAETRDSPFWRPVALIPDDAGEATRARLTRRYRAVIAGRVVPAYRRLHDFLARTYLPAARDSAGLGALPGGESWYAHLVRVHTTTSLTPEAIHRLGRSEVARLTAALQAATAADGGRRQARPARGARTFRSADEMLDAYRSLRERVDAALPRLFDRSPRAGFRIRAVEPFRQRSSPGAFYTPAAPDGSRPGIFWVNTRDWRSRTSAGSEALYLHEAVPGHHFQISLQRERTDLPRFRRFSRTTAFTEGWGLYAESLGEELGLYRDPREKVAALRSELFRARRLVVDTGLHALGWSRARAIDYLGSVSEVERYMALPGQALAYKTGELQLDRLRARAEEHLGDRFDPRAFHAVVLEEGALPLDLVERRVDAWLAAQPAAP